MTRRLVALVVVTVVLRIGAAWAGAPGAPVAPPSWGARVEAALPAIRAMAQEPKVVAMVRAQNARKLTLTEIQRLDKEWMAASGTTPFMKTHLDNDCARALLAHAGELKALAEAFAMDNQGALVCTTRKTSDYWQGDEEKWSRSYNKGVGTEFIDKPQFDESSQTFAVQISVPVKDAGKTIGAITVTLNLDRL